MTADKIAALAATPRKENANAPENIPLAVGCTVAAWIHPKPGEQGRILDHGTPGQPDGITLDSG